MEHSTDRQIVINGAELKALLLRALDQTAQLLFATSQPAEGVHAQDL